MGILPYNSGNYDYNSINDPNYDIKRQLSTRQAQLDKLNAYDSLTDDQLRRKQSLERTVETLSDKIGKKESAQNAHFSSNKTKSAPINAASGSLENTSAVSAKPSVQSAYPRKTFSEGTVLKKNDAYLKGFFFDTRI